MTDNRRMTTDRFYGGVSNRLQNLRSMLEYIRSTNPSRSELNKWVISNTRAGSADAVSHHLTFLASIELIELSESGCELDNYGEQWLEDGSPETLYEALSSGVKGFETILQSLAEVPMTDEDIMDLLVTEFDEAEMTKPGPAKRHREWLQVLGYVERRDSVNRLIKKGQNLIEPKKSDVVDIDELRKKATEDAIDEVEQTISIATSAQYNRSSKIKDYVKARADGVCEGCNEPAPFTSKAGEAYLHAHHVHELSNGGSDTPDTVIALCPNCHYRVHHGEDGEEYNQELLEIVQEKESKQS